MHPNEPVPAMTLQFTEPTSMMGPREPDQPPAVGELRSSQFTSTVPLVKISSLGDEKEVPWLDEAIVHLDIPERAPEPLLFFIDLAEVTDISDNSSFDANVMEEINDPQDIHSFSIDLEENRDIKV